MTRADGKRDRDEMFVEYTKSICPVCKVVVDAQVNIRHDKVYLRKRCREHGSFEALVYGDAQMYLESARFNKPGTFPLRFQTEVRDGCPSDCGLCPDHKQHACLGLIEVNTHCNLDCPICFADSGHQPDGYAITAAQCERMLDTLVAAEGEPEVVMFSGGEPTIHKQLLEFVDAAQARPVKTVIINTNGIRLASDRRFVDQLATRNRPGHPVHIYLQFDGLDEATHRRIRGHDLRDVKQRALDNCAAAGLTVSLVAAVERGLNEHELGAVIRHGMAQPGVQSVVFQPVTHAGRHVQFDPLTRLTNSDIIACITAQLPEWFRPGDFFPVPCCFPSCRSITYLLTDGEHVVPIPRLLNVEDYLDYVSNRVIPDLAIREALENLWSASAVPGTDTMTAQLQRATAALNCAEGCGINLPEALTHLTDRVFAIVIQDFQDPYTLNVKQLMKCCVQQITPDGRLIPFCAYNSVGYREQVREQLTGVPVPDIVPNAIPLAGLLADAPHGSKQANTGGSIARLAGPTRGAPMALPPHQIKACCADAYSRDIVALLLGDSFHPGGATLTRRLADQLGLRSTGDPRRVACRRRRARRLRTAAGQRLRCGCRRGRHQRDQREARPSRRRANRPDRAGALPPGRRRISPVARRHIRRAGVRVRVLHIPGQERRRPAVRSDSASWWPGRHHRCHCRGRRPAGGADPIGRVGRLHRRRPNRHRLHRHPRRGRIAHPPHRVS